MMKILVVEDERLLADSLQTLLTAVAFPSIRRTTA